MHLSAPIHHLKRRARLMARERSIPLSQALDHIARAEGYARWSHLAAHAPKAASPGTLLSWLEPGDVMLLGARPGHGKTRLGLQLLIEALRDGRRAACFTLEYTPAQALVHLRAAAGGDAGLAARVELDCSDGIGAETIITHLAEAPPGSVALIDYLQILDQRRDTPPLARQMQALHDFARASGVIFVVISQIDRRFDPARGALPGPANVRLPNPVGPHVFSKACFLQDGAISLVSLAAP